MTNCPVCNSQVNEKANFCSECGSQLTTAAFDRAWIVGMQERIKAARHNDSVFNVLATVGLIFVVTIPYITRYIQHFDMDIWSWLLTGVGIVLFVSSVIGMWFDSRKVKQLIEQLEQGKAADTQPDEEEEGAAKAEEQPDKKE
ncbi:MAG: zinc ribbon domain-containing protein [Dehalococcoidales bacterium]|nr:zinc ribbon domain-containing protein [Dehalococcoidales bacterium]